MIEFQCSDSLLANDVSPRITNVSSAHLCPSSLSLRLFRVLSRSFLYPRVDPLPGHTDSPAGGVLVEEEDTEEKEEKTADDEGTDESERPICTIPGHEVRIIALSIFCFLLVCEFRVCVHVVLMYLRQPLCVYSSLLLTLLLCIFEDNTHSVVMHIRLS